VSWLLLILAGLLEVVWAAGLKHTYGFSRFYPSVIVLSAMALSLLLLSYVIRSLPAGTAYAVWSGIGAVGVVIIGIVWEGEPATPARLFSLAMIVAGILGVKLFSH
jgi:quaternary ammonium compound-resistance protein SugE